MEAREQARALRVFVDCRSSQETGEKSRSGPGEVFGARPPMSRAAPPRRDSGRPPGSGGERLCAGMRTCVRVAPGRASGSQTSR